MAPSPIPSQDPAALLVAARDGNELAWRQLVRRLEPGLRRSLGSYRLSASDLDDVVQATWLELFRHAAVVREPGAVAGWLTTVARRLALQRRRACAPEQPSDDPRLGDTPCYEEPLADVLAAERRAILERSLATLPERHGRLMLALTEDNDYRHVSQTLEIPIGSIGPIRARSLKRLARNPELCALQAAA
jgi:RNA polymerase sigma factor (sigma-70 family)